jgi:hypothetical protein
VVFFSFGGPTDQDEVDINTLAILWLKRLEYHGD